MRSIILAATLLSMVHLPLQARQSEGPYVRSWLVSEWSQLEGERVRVTTTDTSPSLEGVLAGVRGDTLHVLTDTGSDPVRIVAGAGFEVQRWRHSDRSTGFAILGVVAGSLAGGLIAHALNDPPAVEPCGQTEVVEAYACAIGSGLLYDFGAAADEMFTVGIGAGIGALTIGLLGYYVGRSIVTEGWQPVRRTGLHLVPTLRGGVGGGIRLVF